jgi:hypothetical protein
LRTYTTEMATKDLISRMGGIRATARCLGHRSHTTVQGWWMREVIPAHRQAGVMAAAHRLGVLVEPLDLIPNLKREDICDTIGAEPAT